MHDRRSVAMHEAAHAVADFRAGFNLGPATIARDPERRTLGTAGGGGPTSYTNAAGEEVYHLEDWRAHVVSLLAGLAAETADGADTEPAERGAASDSERAREAIERWGLEWTFADARRAAGEFVRREWSAIEAVAAELLEHETLDAEEVELVILAADGDADAPAALAAYRQDKARHEKGA